MQLGEAYLLDGELERARELTDQGLEILEKAGYRRGIAWARRTLGRISAIRSGSRPRRVLVPALIVTGRSVFSRSVRHGMPSAVDSS